MNFKYDDLLIVLKPVDYIPLRTNLKVEYAGDLSLHPLSKRKGNGYMMRYLSTIEYSDKIQLPEMKYIWILEEEIKDRIFKVSDWTPELEKTLLRDSRIDEILED